MGHFQRISGTGANARNTFSIPIPTDVIFVTFCAQFTAKEQADIRAVATKLSVVDNDAEEPARNEALSGMRSSGIHVRGTKFMFTRNDYRSIHGTKKVRSFITIRTDIAH